MGARQKINDMLIDKGSLYGGPGWVTHRGNLSGRLMAIMNMINLAKKMGCDVSAEEAAASTLFIPLSPR